MASKTQPGGSKAATIPAGVPLSVSGVAAAKRPGPVGRLFRGIGNGLYLIGYSAEYYAVLAGRVLRDVFGLAGQMLAMAGAWLWRVLRQFVRTLAADMAAPFVRFQKRRAQLGRIRTRTRQRAESQEGASKGLLVSAGLKSSVQFAAGVGGILLPVAAAAVLVFTVYSITTMQYALAVEVDGKVLGYVADQNVVEGAKSLLRDRIRLAENQEVTDWQLNPVYTIARAPGYTGANQLANEILLTGNSGSDIVPATGFYLDGRLFAVTREGEQLKEYLDKLLDEHKQTAPEGAEISFVREIECEPGNDDVFFASSVQGYDELLATLQQNQSEEQAIMAAGDMSLYDIAVANNLTLEELLLRNPSLAGQDGDFVPPEGQEILLRRAQPFLQVQMVLQESYTEELAYSVVEQENPDKPKGMKTTLQKGQPGTQQVVDQLVFIDGEQVERVRMDERTEVVAQPVDEIVEVGTMEIRFAGGMGGGAGIQGSYMFPVPGSPYSSRGFSPGGHRGLDINAPAGTPIYACEGGTVTAAGWHYSYGYYIEIAHPGGVKTLYAHCSQLFVATGQVVGHGQHIGAVGSTGNSSGNHCHLEIFVNGQLVDPVGFVGYPY